MSTYLVTGAAGFIGSKVCECLLADGHRVVGIDNLNDYYDVRLKDYRLARLFGDTSPTGDGDPRLSVYARDKHKVTGRESGQFLFQQVSIESRFALETVFAEHQFDAVFNLAARAGVRASMENPFVFLATNTEGTLNLLECQRKFGVRKQVLASTSSLYAGAPMPWKEDQPVNEPLSPYAATKKGAELMAYSYYKLYGLSTTVVRYFTVFGPAGRPDMSMFRFIKWIDEGSDLEIYGDGQQARDFTYIDDIASGTLLASTINGYEIINLGGGRSPVTLRQVISFIEAALGKEAKVVNLPAHAADIRESWADVSKAERLLSWRPTVSVEDGIGRCVEWYKSNRAFLRHIRL